MLEETKPKGALARDTIIVKNPIAPPAILLEQLVKHRQGRPYKYYPKVYLANILVFL